MGLQIPDSAVRIRSPPLRAQGWLAQLGERMLDVHEATGSSPVPPTKSGFPKTTRRGLLFIKGPVILLACEQREGRDRSG